MAQWWGYVYSCPFPILHGEIAFAIDFVYARYLMLRALRPDCIAPPMTTADHEPPEVTATKRWIEHAVIGLNLCPFAKAVFSKNQIRYAVSMAQTPEAVAGDLHRELEWLAQASAEAVDTTLLILPHAFADFLDFNDFIDVADGLVVELELDGILQVASFHPKFQFADTDADDIGNYTNRAPYPTLHILREDSVERAVAAFPDELEIAEHNIETMEKLGHDGWAALAVGAPATARTG